MNLETLLKILFDNKTLIGVFFAIGGLIKLFIYYKLFGIYIFEFIDIKEVVTLFVNNLFGYFVVLLIMALSLIKIPLLEIFNYSTPIIFSVGTLFYFLLRKKVLIIDLILMNVLFWTMYFVITEFLARNNFSSDFELLQNYTLLILFCSLIVYSVANTWNEFYKVKNKLYYTGTKITFNHEDFESTAEKYYIGKTEKFIFIYNSRLKETEVISANDVKKIVFKKK